MDDTANIMVAWDNSSVLNVVYGEDRCRRLDAVTVTLYGDTKYGTAEKRLWNFTFGQCQDQKEVSMRDTAKSMWNYPLECPR